ncbi:MAG TPA: isoleucine--tRNA ligase, partial [Deltaproteobacteria bacterium]|nr:isoleucine--tRNA ligase [Deltaproteobacteria bacterium]
FRNTPQWFVYMDKDLGDGTTLRSRALSAIDDTRFVPAAGQNRLRAMIEGRPDWVLSRQRAWGVPICVFADAAGNVLQDKQVNDRILEAFEKEGADAWFAEGAKERFLGNAHDAEKWLMVTDILDVWFDSGSSFAAVVRKRPELRLPADLYLEGSDQHRGWFHSSLLISVGNDGTAPYESVLTHGFVVDGKGRKMSKSLGNSMAPEEIIDKYGAEILRLWVTYEDYRDDIRISKEIVDRIVETYRRIRNTFRFLHANIHEDFDPRRDRQPYENLSSLDKWMLSRLMKLTERVTEAYRAYAFHTIFHSIQNFCSVDLSALYLDIVKDRMYVGKKDSVKRRASQTVVFDTLLVLMKLAAPILAFTTEEMWGYMGPYVDEKSVLLTRFPKVKDEYIDQALEDQWDRVWRIREAVNKKIEEKRVEKVIGHPLDAKVVLTVPEDDFSLLSGLDELKDVLIVSQVELRKGSELEVEILRAEGPKCERCWQYSTDIETGGDYPNICKRCRDTLSS